MTKAGSYVPIIFPVLHTSAIVPLLAIIIRSSPLLHTSERSSSWQTVGFIAIYIQTFLAFPQEHDFSDLLPCRRVIVICSLSSVLPLFGYLFIYLLINLCIHFLYYSVKYQVCSAGIYSSSVLWKFPCFFLSPAGIEYSVLLPLLPPVYGKEGHVGRGTFSLFYATVTLVSKQITFLLTSRLAVHCFFISVFLFPLLVLVVLLPSP